MSNSSQEFLLFLLAALAEKQRENSQLKERIEELENGSYCDELRENFRRELEEKDRTIKKLREELFDTRMQFARNQKHWQEVNSDLLAYSEKQTAKLSRKLQRERDAKFKAQGDCDNLQRQLSEKELEIDALQKEKTETDAVNKELTARLNRDYTNSSKPSSSDPNHGKIYNGREKSERKPGGQPGHPHHPRKMQEVTSEPVFIPASEKFLDPTKYKPTGDLAKRQLVILRCVVEVIEYSTPVFQELKSGKKVHAPFPENLPNEVNYDGSVKAFSYLLVNQCNVSVGKTKDFIKDITGGKLDLSTGMINGFAREFSKKTEEERNRIFLELLASPTMHADFTFGRLNGKQGTVMICATPNAVLYQAKERKGNDGVKGSPVEFYQGTLITDHEAALIKHGTRHQECLVHVERYLRSIIENEENRSWASKMLDWIRRAIHYRNEVIRNAAVLYPDEDPVKKAAYDPEKTDALKQEYDEILEVARNEYQSNPPAKHFREGINLYKRMSEGRKDYLLFLDDVSVEPDNNLAERKARVYKMKARQVLSFRSQEGMASYCDSLSVLESIRAKGGNVYEAVVARFNNENLSDD